MNFELLLLYTSVAFFYVISPGPAIFLAISNSLSADMRAVFFSSLGNICGLCLLSSISMLGLGALIMTSALLFSAIKIVGTLYLLYLGWRQFKLAKSASINAFTPLAGKVKTHWQYYTEGFLLAATNPKPILFFTALFPQFLDLERNIGPQFFVMTAIFMAFSMLSLMSYANAFKNAKKLMSKPSFSRWFHRITGGVFISMGALLLQLKSH